MSTTEIKKEANLNVNHALFNLLASELQKKNWFATKHTTVRLTEIRYTTGLELYGDVVDEITPIISGYGTAIYLPNQHVTVIRLK